jgi:O-antigen/teichoic acid export membrane protein
MIQARQPVALTATLGLGQLIGRGALAVGLLILVRELSATDFGDLSLALAVVQVLMTVADGGFSRLLVRDVARDGASGAGLVKQLLAARMLSVVAVLVLTAAGLIVIPGPFSAAFSKPNAVDSVNR